MGTRLDIFCTPAEQCEWMELLCHAYDLTCLSYDSDLDQACLLGGDLSSLQGGDGERAFLLPRGTEREKALAFERIEPRRWGWIDVTLARIIEKRGKRMLTLAQIVAEDYEIEPVHPERYVRWLKRQLKPALGRGVKGRNPATGGESEYRNIYYTDGATSLLHSGIQWRHSSNTLAEFEPLQ
jgi:hypothetical protein